MIAVPKSLSDAIGEEPDRFVKYFNLDKISSSKNPYLEFLRQFERRFGKKQGLYLWQYLLDNYDLTNDFYSFKKLQNKLPVEFKGDIDKETVLEYFENYHNRVNSRQKKIDSKKKQVKVGSYQRDGKTVKSYTANQPHKYSEIQNNFILRNKEKVLMNLADEFNRLFSTRITTFGIRDKRLRLLGKKK